MHSSSSLVVPPLLGPGARVALVAPAGPLRGPEDVAIAEAQARAFGWEPAVGSSALAKHAYFAGDDAARLRDVNAAIADRAVDGIWCLRGGYGAIRLLDGLDYEALRAAPKPLIGYSDVTAVHAAVNARSGTVSYHGPTARERLSDFSRASLFEAIITGGDPCGRAATAHTVHGGTARGRLAGGNLALVAALCGTPYAVDFDGALLVLEDVNEPVYRIDRMLQQLLLSGMRRCAGLVLGAFTGMPDGGSDEGRTAADVFAEVVQSLGIPCIANAPVGHIDEQWTLPFGRIAELDADALTLHVA